MAQKGSMFLHRVPYSLVWTNTFFDKKNMWNSVFGSELAKKYLNRSLSYYCDSHPYFLWLWSDTIYNATLSFFFKKYYVDSECQVFFNYINRRIFFAEPFRETMLLNTNRGSNKPSFGTYYMFEHQDCLYVFNAYYLLPLADAKFFFKNTLPLGGTHSRRFVGRKFFFKKKLNKSIIVNRIIGAARKTLLGCFAFRRKKTHFLFLKSFSSFISHKLGKQAYIY